MSLTFQICEVNSVDSTNQEIHRLAEKNAPEGTVVIAEQQTAGRGRFGRCFYSPSQTGLYMSVLLHPDCTQMNYITAIAAVAVAEAIEALTGETALIKWVNDVYCRGKKVCGILTEGVWDADTLRYAVLGIGVNISPPNSGFPKDIVMKAGAVWENTNDIRRPLAQEILQRFASYYESASSRDFVNEYRRRSFLVGRTVTILAPDGTPQQTVTVLSIDDDCGLVVEGEHGVQTLSSGEISLEI